MSPEISHDLIFAAPIGRSSASGHRFGLPDWSCKRSLQAPKRGMEFESIKMAASAAAADGRLSLPPRHCPVYTEWETSHASWRSLPAEGCHAR
ncbi:hypothetical protein N9996_01275 [Synechococcus sp. AH-603-M21]|nr:hypothetical protein [Synechococcus sp. AH-603-M21]